MSEDSSKRPVEPRSHTAPGWSVALLVVGSAGLIYILSQVVGVVALGVYAVSQHWSAAQIDAALTSNVGVEFAYSLLVEGLVLLGVYGMLRWFKWSWQSIGLLKPKLLHLAIGAVSIVPYFMLLFLIVAVVKWFVPSLDIGQKQEIGFNVVQGPLQLVLAFISLVILPPLAEEIMMRGYMFTGLKKFLPWTISGLIVSVLFGAAHLAEGGDVGPLWIGAIDTFTLSLVLVVLREKTGNLWGGIILHALKNLVAFYALFIVGGR